MAAFQVPLPPLLVLSTRASLVLRLSTLARVAEQARLDGIDLDLTGRPLAARRGPLLASEDGRAVPIRSVWVPRPGFLRGLASRRTIASAVAIADAARADQLLVDVPIAEDGKLARSLVTGTVESLRSRLGPATGVTVALRPWQLEGGRGHLAMLTALRRLAEEWDFGVALDLLGTIDPSWEVEAAITRLGGRLTLVRLGGEARSGRGYWRRRAAHRALATVIDNGQRPTLSLGAMACPWWQTA